jgi:hypothetical protein
MNHGQIFEKNLNLSVRRTSIFAFPRADADNNVARAVRDVHPTPCLRLEIVTLQKRLHLAMTTNPNADTCEVLHALFVE